MFPATMKQKMLADYEVKLPTKHVAGPDEVAEAYLFLMKYVCGFGLWERPGVTDAPAGATTSLARESMSKEALCWCRCTTTEYSIQEVKCIFTHRDKYRDPGLRT